MSYEIEDLPIVSDEEMAEVMKHGVRKTVDDGTVKLTVWLHKGATYIEDVERK